MIHEHYSLLRGNRFLQHGGLLVSLEAETILTLLLQKGEPRTVAVNNVG